MYRYSQKCPLYLPLVPIPTTRTYTYYLQLYLLHVPIPSTRTCTYHSYLYLPLAPIPTTCNYAYFLYLAFELIPTTHNYTYFLYLYLPLVPIPALQRCLRIFMAPMSVFKELKNSKILQHFVIYEFSRGYMDYSRVKYDT